MLRLQGRDCPQQLVARGGSLTSHLKATIIYQIDGKNATCCEGKIVYELVTRLPIEPTKPIEVTKPSSLVAAIAAKFDEY